MRAEDAARRSKEALWRAVVSGDETAAGRAAFAGLDAGLDAETVLIEVVGGVQRRLGDEWAGNRLTVAQEHAATAISERVIATLGSTVGHPRPHLPRIAVTCVDGEWHALPARLFAEVLSLHGFHVDYLGGQLPAVHLVAHLRTTAPRTVALSCSLAPRLPTAHATISACHSAGIPVLAGGGAFGSDGRYASALGADLWAAGPREAAAELTRGLPSNPRDARVPIDDLPHLADQEYTLVTRFRARLVRAMRDALGRSGRDQERLLESLAQFVDYVRVALYLDDSLLLAEHLVWVKGFLSARQVPDRFLEPALDALGGELHDFPRAVAMLSEARHDAA